MISFFTASAFASNQIKMPRQTRKTPIPIGPDQKKTNHMSISTAPCVSGRSISYKLEDVFKRHILASPVDRLEIKS